MEGSRGGTTAGDEGDGALAGDWGGDSSAGGGGGGTVVEDVDVMEPTTNDGVHMPCESCCKYSVG
jgi:hypothetical protein